MTATVIVMCKLPTGLALDLEPDNSRKIVLNGANHPDAVNGAGLTQVPADFWEAWSTKFKGYEPLTTGKIWAADKEADAKAQAKELKDEKTGFEGLNADAPMPGLEPTEEQKKENAKIQKKD